MMAGKKLTGRVWFRAILCAFVSVAIVVAAFTFGDQFKHIAEKHDEKIDAYQRSVAAGDGIGASSSSGPTVGSFEGEEEPEEGSPNALEQADADEAENAEDAADGADPTEEKEETPTADPEQQSASASSSDSSDVAAAAAAASDPALITDARCGGQPASMLPFASATRHHRRRTLFDEVDEVAVDATWPGAGAGAGVDANLTASIVVDAAAAAIDLAEVYTRQEQQRLQGMHPAASSRRRNLLHRTIGYTMGKAGCGKELTVRVEHENDGAGPTPRRTVKPGEEALAACLQQPERCGAGSREAGRSLPGVSALRKAPKVQLTGLLPKGKTFKSCAIVGNAGHLNNHEYGKYIDNHEAVVRFNILPVAGFEKHIGAKTTLRMLNNRRSVALCCRGNFPEGRAGRTDSSETGVMIWFPEAQSEILGACKRRFPSNPRFAIPMSVNKAMAEAMRKMRSDATRLGLGPFNQWRQMTSGAHAILLFSQLCDRVSLYGFTTFGSTKGGPDQYAGRSERARSGTIWHDWGGEKGVWRMMYAAGAVDICSA